MGDLLGRHGNARVRASFRLVSLGAAESSRSRCRAREAQTIPAHVASVTRSVVCAISPAPWVSCATFRNRLGMDVSQHCMPSLGQHDRRDKFGFANPEYVVDVSQEQMEPTPEETLSGAMATQRRCTSPCIVGCTPSLELKEISRCPAGTRRGQPERSISIQTGYRCA